MEFWRISVKLFNGEKLDFVSERVLVREWLSYYLGKCSCGFVWSKKGVINVDQLENWDMEEVEYCFYRKGYDNKIVWEKWDRSLLF